MTIVNNSVWKNIIAAKKQTSGWETKIPEQQLIDEIVEELHRYCPSKQNLCRYEIVVLKNFLDEERKLKLYKSSPRMPDNPDTNYNPQLLAPYVFVFFTATRNIVKESTHDASIMDIGIASTFICYSAIAKGLDIGFCACTSEDMRELFDGKRPRLLLGVGYKNKNKNDEWNFDHDPADWWHCPIKKENVQEPQHIFSTKPSAESYIRYDKHE